MCCERMVPGDDLLASPGGYAAPSAVCLGPGVREMRLRAALERVLSRNDAHDPCIAVLTGVVLRVILEEGRHEPD